MVTIILETNRIKKNIYVAPLLAEDLSNLPQAIVITAECDVLRDEGLAYAKRLKDAVTAVEAICEEGLVHGYFTNMAVFSDRIKDTISKIDQFLTESEQRIKNV
ncbi:acetyl esterase [Lentibacillus persicus]|uniref:Acetyl esterase n=1 Tax=Lentibacillus persicus TaxID=640948 RepID=A0A1I1S9T7_9BACI|nr:alpha/beta hydrolase fold domain-containing protein [Lentibacillus persicus]SFD43259.1 acetyl esterase [Lentibacillus persicus]